MNPYPDAKTGDYLVIFAPAGKQPAGALSSATRVNSPDQPRPCNHRPIAAILRQCRRVIRPKPRRPVTDRGLIYREAATAHG